VVDFEIVALNENLKDNYDFSKFPEVRYIKNNERIGVDACRQKGVELSRFSNCAIFDAHMRFKKDNWASKMIKYIEDNPQTLWCTTCIAIGWGTLDINNHKGKYFAANLRLFTEQEKDRPCRLIIEPTWAAEKPEKEYKVDCILGANYFFLKDWFLHIGGLKGLKSWGTSEPFISIKSYLSGGDCRISKDIEIAHLFRDTAPYATPVSSLVYNKLYVLKTIFPKEMEDKLLRYIPQDKSYKKAIKWIEEDRDQIRQDRKNYEYIFRRDIYDYFREFDVKVPE